MHLLEPHPHRIAMLSAHTSPLGRLGSSKAGGMNVYVRETALELGRLGYQVDVFTRDDGVTEPVVDLAPGVRVVHLEAGPRTPLDKEALWEAMPAFLNSLRVFRARAGLRYDLVHSHYWMSGWAGTYLQRLWNVPHITMFHTLGEVKNRAREDEHEPSYRIRAERRIVETADAVVAATEDEVMLLERLYQADAEQIAIIPCGVDVHSFRPHEQEAARGALGLGPEPLVLFVGRLEPLKGLDLLVEALPLLAESAVLLVVGGDEQARDYVSSLQARAAELGVADRLRFVGAVPHDRLPLYYAAADLCAVPSFYESFGLVALEAMACGTPVVASRVGGLPATVRDGENGYLIPWRSPQAFAARMNAIVTDPEGRERMSRNARRTAERFQWARVACDLDQLYTEVWAARAGAFCHEDGEPVAAGGAHHLCHIG